MIGCVEGVDAKQYTAIDCDRSRCGVHQVAYAAGSVGIEGFVIEGVSQLAGCDAWHWTHQGEQGDGLAGLPSDDGVISDQEDLL